MLQRLRQSVAGEQEDEQRHRPDEESFDTRMMKNSPDASTRRIAQFQEARIGTRGAA